MNCEAFGHVVMKFGGELYRFPARDFLRFFLIFRTVHRDVGRDGLDDQIPKETWQFEDFFGIFWS